MTREVGDSVGHVGVVRDPGAAKRAMTRMGRQQHQAGDGEENREPGSEIANRYEGLAREPVARQPAVAARPVACACDMHVQLPLPAAIRPTG
jgi:hypothetical protein